MSYDDDMGHDADVDSGFESGASDDGLVAVDPTTGRSRGTQALLDAVQKSSQQELNLDDFSGVGPDEDWNSPAASFARGDTILNPNATFFDWITAPVELALNVGSRIATGGLLGLDVQFGQDVTGYKGQTDVSQYAGGITGPQAPGVQVDVGILGVSGVLGPIAPDIATISVDQKGLGIHSTFDPSQGALMNAAKDAIKGAASYYAGGGLASLPQITNSGLYRALGRG